MRRFLIWIFIAFTTIASGQNPVLQSGPMLGPVTLRDCSIWFQTKTEATVQIAYHMVDGNKEEKESNLRNKNDNSTNSRNYSIRN